ncbi:hypothetical protein NBRC116602_04390 [Hyphomicrobiales bacterium 4NK60-0047b]
MTSNLNAKCEVSGSASSYNWMARQFHWFIAALIFIAFALGWTMEGLELSKDKLNFYAWHKWLGLFILALVVLRLCWRFMTKVPKHSSPQVPVIIHFGAQLGHFLLYAVLILLPLVGWLRSSTAGFQIVILEILPVPDLLGKDEALSKQLAEVHELLALFLALLVGGHVAAVVLHHVFFKDPVLQKMKPHLLHKTLIACTLLGGLGFYVTYSDFSASEKTKISSEIKGTEGITKGGVSEETGSEGGWVVDQKVSLLEFTAKQKGAKTTGAFKEYKLKQLFFNPEALDKSVVEIEIDVTSISLSNLLVEQTLASSAWFDASEFPKALFRSKQFKSLGSDVYEVSGDLQIKDITHPTVLKLTIQLEDRDKSIPAVIQANGETSISRLAYKIGQGEWASTDDLSDEVQLKVHIRALKKR